MTVAVASISPLSHAGQEPIRVMVVDDAVVVRGLVSRWVEAEPDLKIVASLRTGQEAIDQLAIADPDVVLLDVDMPVLDGIAALPLLLEKKRHLVVIMVSTITRRSAEVTLRALLLGAADYIPKPASNHEVTTSATFHRELIDKIRHLGWRRRAHKPRSLVAGANAATAAPAQGAVVRLDRHRDSYDGKIAAAPLPQPAAILPPQTPTLVSLQQPLPSPAEIKLRPFAATTPRILLIGSSTGGPKALGTLLAGLAGVLDRAPVLITQHMPATFTTILAEQIARVSGRPAHEAEDGEPILAGSIYVAPGGRHMRVARRNGTAVAVIDDAPPINFCKPAVDPLFSSAAQIWGGWNLGVILTGMGSDGSQGAADVVAAGGSILAQDEATSIVWGMPGAVAHAGLCSAVLPLERIAAKVTRLFLGDRQ
jgi:two-component system chemotaxis response regulator CheB